MAENSRKIMTGIKDNQIMDFYSWYACEWHYPSQQRKIQSPQLARRIGIFVRIHLELCLEFRI